MEKFKTQWIANEAIVEIVLEELAIIQRWTSFHATEC